MKRIEKWISFVAAVALLSCEDPISIELPQGDPYVVVEGWITNRPGPYRVTLSETLPFNSPESNPSISNARVLIVTNRGSSFELTEDAQNPGEYLTDSVDFVGVPGTSYTLEVRIGEKLIVSTSELLGEAPAIDTIEHTFVEGIFVPETLSFTSGYLITGYVSDPESNGNYYRWQITENGLPYQRAEDMVLITDRFFNGKRFGFELSKILFQLNDTVTIDQYTLNKQSFEFLRNLNIQAIGLGKSSSTPPSVVRGNLQNINDVNEIVLGYFGASGISSSTIVIVDQQ